MGAELAELAFLRHIASHHPLWRFGRHGLCCCFERRRGVGEVFSHRYRTALIPLPHFWSDGLVGMYDVSGGAHS